MTDVLPISLDAAVPLHIAELRTASQDDRARIARDSADTVASQGDVLQYGGTGCAQAFNALARGLAAAAYQPGGITYAGRHWCTDHAACQRAEQETN